jgi:hypothetical protein
MAYMSQEHKAKIAPVVKEILKKYGVKGTLAVRHHSSLVLNIKSGKIDFIENYIKTDAASYCAKKMDADQIAYIRTKKTLDINEYWYQEHFTGKAKSFLKEIIAAMKGPEYFNNDDAMTDYFHRSHYIDINVGAWNKPYEVL